MHGVDNSNGFWGGGGGVWFVWRVTRVGVEVDMRGRSRGVSISTNREPVN